MFRKGNCNFHILVLLGGLHHNEIPLVIKPFMEVIVMGLWETQTQSVYDRQIH